MANVLATIPFIALEEDDEPYCSQEISVVLDGAAARVLKGVISGMIDAGTIKRETPAQAKRALEVILDAIAAGTPE